MKQIIIIVVITFFLLSGCIGRNPKRTQIAQDTVYVEETMPSPFNESMENMIRYCIDYMITDFRVPAYDKVYTVGFYEVYGKCYGYVYACEFYNKERVSGYTYLDGYTVAYEGVCEKCNKGLVDLEKLMPYNDTIPGFSDISTYYGYIDPSGIEFQIISQDSVVVTHKGMI